MNRWRAAAAAWGAVALLAALALGLQLRRGLSFETGLLSLLPGDARRPLVGEAVARMAESGSHQIVVLVGSKDAAAAGRAADACAARLNGRPGVARVLAKLDGGAAGLARDFYFPWRYRLLSPEQRRRLTAEPDGALLDRALAQLYSPLGPPRLAPLESDPFGLFGEGLLAAASRGALRLQDGRLVVAEGGTTWVAVLVELSDGGLSIGRQRALLRDFDDAGAAARAAGADDVLRAGFLFHSAQASRQAQWEMSTIGLGSMVGIAALMALAFGSLKPLFLSLLPIAVGCVTALGLSLLIFSRLHLLTLVFGASIIGVAVDYGVLFVCGCAAPGPWDPEKRRRDILPSVALAAATSLLAYAALAAMPFPILRQMGVFTMIGLASAWLTAVLWVPLLAATMPRPASGALPSLLLRCRRVWPRVGRSRPLVLALGAGALFSLWGVARLRSDDDVHQLYQSFPETVRQQDKVQQLLKLPDAGQFFLVTASDEQKLLEREEDLTGELDALNAKGAISGFQSVSRYVPSQKRQEADAALQWKRLYRPGGLAAKLFARLDSPETAVLARTQARAAAPPLTPEAWLSSPLSAPFRSLWLGGGARGWASVVTLSGVPDGAGPLLAAVAARHEGVEFVDHLALLSSLLARLRGTVVRLMAGGYAVVSALLFLRYRGEAWRVLLPAVLACLGTAGLFGALGLNCNLFCVFGLLLSLDMGVDYGIYMHDKGSGDFRVSLLSTSLAAMTAILSFGLLGLSRTPALRIFGLTVLLAIGGSWLLAPCFSKGEPA